MTAKTRLQLAALFENNDVPTAAGFVDLFDSFISRTDTATDPQRVASGLTVAGTFLASGGATFSAGQTVNMNGNNQVNGPTFVATIAFEQKCDASISAAGSAQAAAYVLTGRYNVVKAGAVNQGVLASAGAQAGRAYTVFNRLGVQIFLYPETGGTIDGLAANVPVTISGSAALTMVYTSAKEAFTIRGVPMA